MIAYYGLFYLIYFLTAIPVIGAIMLPILGLIVKKSKPELSKKLMKIGVTCLCITGWYFAASIATSILNMFTI